MTWLPIETAPHDVRVLLWWTPRASNRHAEAAITGVVSSHSPGDYWDGTDYRSLDRITHWQPLPPPPETDARAGAALTGGAHE